MELLTQNLPTGHNYGFRSIRVNPMNFAQVLEYLENVPSTEVEKYYYDYCLVKGDDKNVDQLLLPDLEYVIFYKKGLTISDKVVFNSTIICNECGSGVPAKFDILEVKFAKLDEQVREGIRVQIAGAYHDIRIPTVEQFFTIFDKYRRYKKLSDMKLIKLICLFVGTHTHMHNAYENLVINAKYEDITMLTMLHQLCYEVVEPIKVYCPICNSKRDADQKRGMAVEMKSLTANFFREIIDNNRLTDSKIIFREVLQQS